MRVSLSAAVPISSEMNKRGHPQTLVRAHPGNQNAVKQGIHSARLMQARAAEIASELGKLHEFSLTEQVAVQEMARCIAIIEAIDRDLDERGLVDSEGAPRNLLNYRARMSRQLEQWLAKVSAAIEQEDAGEPPSSSAEFPDYVRALQQIALGQDASATARDRLAAVKELLELGPRGTSSYLDRPAQSELRDREHAIREQAERQSIEKRERNLGFAD
jgi:hypothetical protein